MYKPDTSPFLIEVLLRDGTWAVYGSSKTIEKAVQNAEQARAAIRGEDYRITDRRTNTVVNTED